MDKDAQQKTTAGRQDEAARRMSRALAAAVAALARSGSAPPART